MSSASSVTCSWCALGRATAPQRRMAARGTPAAYPNSQAGRQRVSGRTASAPTDGHALLERMRELDGPVVEGKHAVEGVDEELELRGSARRRRQTRRAHQDVRQQQQQHAEVVGRVGSLPASVGGH